MKKKRNRAKENLELAEEHISLAEDLVLEEAKNSSKKKVQKSLSKAAFELEKAESHIKEV